MCKTLSGRLSIFLRVDSGPSRSAMAAAPAAAQSAYYITKKLPSSPVAPLSSSEVNPSNWSPFHPPDTHHIKTDSRVAPSSD